LKAKRAYLTDREETAMRERQGHLCGCGCGEPLDDANEGVIREHVFLMVALGNDDKPDSIWRFPCADKKTNGLCGDKWRIAKVKRIRDKRTQRDRLLARGYSLIQGRSKLDSRGFDKSLSKKMDGTVVRNG